ncbi:DLA class II histocompatibility antigen, DR-1 beta chain-like [Platysternon megacephalum]|uniref:DLA class II histocompatibility antigen, DR-1 beta chain-like n=1 Tax=Platysternon megacephalum TaxID=55544 RepID=A0A4D9DMD2_9SAUR|nr:DLA class II histocompatibility antigen, DR-1 beta chain-like [Platysternon megacephalum]
MSEEEFKAAVQEGNLKEAALIGQQMMKSPGLFEIAVVGESGSGKSSFVNAFLGLADDDIGAAEVGMVETTEWSTLYSHPEYRNVFLWDLPGIGTPHFQSIEHKMTDTYLSGYDFFLIVTATRFRDIHASLARKIQENAKKFYFVRSKVDQDLGAEKRKINYSEARTLGQIREDCQAHLQRAGVNDPQVFLLSSWESDKHDFPLLKETLDKEFRQAMLQKLLDTSCWTLQEKKTDMQKTTWKSATLSGGPGAIPLPGLSLVADMVVLVNCMRDYCQDFGLNSDSLTALAEQVGKREEELKAMIRSPLATEITTDLVLKLLEKCAGEGVTYLTYFASSMPVVGSLFSAQVSLGTTVFMLRNFISDLAEDTQRVLAKALEGEEKKSKQHHQEIDLPVMHEKNPTNPISAGGMCDTGRPGASSCQDSRPQPSYIHSWKPVCV